MLDIRKLFLKPSKRVCKGLDKTLDSTTSSPTSSEEVEAVPTATGRTEKEESNHFSQEVAKDDLPFNAIDHEEQQFEVSRAISFRFVNCLNCAYTRTR